MEEETLRTGFDPNTRELCPDGGCIGIIGADGRCAECGKTSLPKSRSAVTKPPKSDGALASDGPKDTRADTKGTSDHPREIEGDDFDPDRRELCSDGACIGVIGTDGRCAECGKASSHGGRTAGQGQSTSAPSADDHGEDDNADDNSEGAPHHQSDATTGTDGESETLEERQLCPDGTCVGVIGSNGRCKSCGTRAE